MSKEYIDKSALYEKFAQLEKLARNRYLETPSSSLCHSMYMTQLNERTALKHIIADFPSADVAEVVRCRDCKYWGDESGKLQRSDGALFARCKVHNYLLDGRHTGWCPTENDFCSYGERKDGDSNE